MLDQFFNDKTEGNVQKYLETHEEILMVEFGNLGWYFNLILPQFSFGDQYRCDFMILKGQSCSYWIELVELQAPSAKLFNKNGNYSKDLNEAIRQVENWDAWIRENQDYFRKTLKEKIKKKYHDFDEDFNNPRRFISNSHIVIGRRESLSDKDNDRRYMAKEKSGIDIITYDRLFDIEKKINNGVINNGRPIITPYWNN